ncbi:acetyl-CoA hydrolase/transferase C-terminal domain-containing protein [Bacillus sp. JJ1532]|uniref:acetyl-CoA hydrolase/transferase family protein n=1 Tax=Bacillus sp. JJ1532 TaxID=3122958 RepID=UPI002FFEAE47
MYNNDWKSHYQNRLSSAGESILSIQSFQKVFLAPFCNEPQTLVEEIVHQKSRLQDVTLYNIVVGSKCHYADEDSSASFNVRTFLASPLLKSSFSQGRSDYIPVNLSEIPRWIEENPIDVALIQISPPNENGYCNLGLSVDVVQALIKNAKYVIAEVNSQLPITFGNTFVHVLNIDRFVPSSRPLLSIPSSKSTDVEKAIGEFVAELIPNYSTIQVGIGSVSDSILRSLRIKKGLGVHSGSITDPIMELMKLGVVTNEKKAINKYKTVCTTLTGTEKLYQFAHQNPSIELYPTDYTHNPSVLAQLEKFHSINSALEVDLYGQINAEQVGPYPVAGVGGQMDFIKGSRLSAGGKAIIALPSTAKKGKYSRIKVSVPYVTSIKSEIDYVVTEYGVASLFGKSLKERSKELLRIAHPDFREELSYGFEKNSLGV